MPRTPNHTDAESQAAEAETRAKALEAFRDLLDRLDTDLIEQDEADDHT